MTRKYIFFGLWGSLVVFTAAHAQENVSTNLIPDGGFENVSLHIVNYERHIYDAIQRGCELGEEGAPIVYLPSNFTMFCECNKKMRVIEGQPGKEVYAGQRALLLNGSIYILHYWLLPYGGRKVETGDVFKARYFARGKGKVRLVLYLVNAKGQGFGQVATDYVAVDGDEWKLVEHRLDTAGHPQLQSMLVRLETRGDIVLDEISLVKENKEAKQ